MCVAHAYLDMRMKTEGNSLQDIKSCASTGVIPATQRPYAVCYDGWFVIPASTLFGARLKPALFAPVSTYQRYYVKLYRTTYSDYSRFSISHRRPDLLNFWFPNDPRLYNSRDEHFGPLRKICPGISKVGVRKYFSSFVGFWKK